MTRRWIIFLILMAGCSPCSPRRPVNIYGREFPEDWKLLSTTYQRGEGNEVLVIYRFDMTAEESR